MLARQRFINKDCYRALDHGYNDMAETRVVERFKALWQSLHTAIYTSGYQISHHASLHRVRDPVRRYARHGALPVATPHTASRRWCVWRVVQHQWWMGRESESRRRHPN